MMRVLASATVLLLLLGACGGDRAAPWTETPEGAELSQAMVVAQVAFEENRRSTEAHRLIGAVRLFTPAGYVWRVTYKLASLLPENPNERLIGAGGETFVNVNLATGKAEVRFGE